MARRGFTVNFFGIDDCANIWGAGRRQLSVRQRAYGYDHHENQSGEVFQTEIHLSTLPLLLQVPLRLLERLDPFAVPLRFV